ncbi:acyl-coenzyme A oxidase [Haplosporangium sp. Z 27]|nr:acyl-coenzyme A oxidase [Haplosporangium sp. Z 27]
MAHHLHSQDRPRSSFFNSPSPPIRVPYSRTDLRALSDDSYGLRRSANVAQNLSRLADLQIVPSNPRSSSSSPQGNFSSANLSQVNSNDERTSALGNSTNNNSNNSSNNSNNNSNNNLTVRIITIDQRNHPSRSDYHYRRITELPIVNTVHSVIHDDDDDTEEQDESDDEDDSDNDENIQPLSFTQNMYSPMSARFDRSQRLIISFGDDHISTRQQRQQPSSSSSSSSQRRAVPATPQRTSSRIWPNQEANSQPLSRLHERHLQEHYQSPDHHQRSTNPPRSTHIPRRRSSTSEVSVPVVDGQLPRPAFLSQPVYQLACAACIRPLCLRAMKAVMLSDHSKELYSTDMPPAGLQLVNEDRQVRHCACRIRDSACLGCGQVAGYHVTQPCSDCLGDQNNGHFWMFYSSAVYHYKRNRIDGSTGEVMLWANIPPISYDQSLSQQLRLEVPVLSIQTTPVRPVSGVDNQISNDDRPMTACVEMEDWLNSPMKEVVVGKSRVQDVKLGLELSHRLYQLKEEHNFDKEDLLLCLEFIDEYLPVTLHETAFIPVIYAQGSDEQAKYWGPLAEKHQIIGCYAQTELGHGSNLSQLETTATLNRDSDEWIIHSTTFTASKWWIGGLGAVATHALIQARLIIDGKDYGAHGFIVPIRSLKDHRPFPGVKVGDIGPKSYGGFSKIDNGFVRFDNHPIPRENMLMRFAKVTRDGKYVKPPHSKLSYGSMVLLRSGMVRGAALTLARATTIATRYATVRRQFHVPTSRRDTVNVKLETQVINYPMVQARLFPMIAQAYAILAAGDNMLNMYQSMLSELMQGDISSLAEVHAISSGLKSTCSTMAATGVEDCRKLMGGHGYSYFSGISHLWSSYGDNFLLTQQPARYLLKQIKLAVTEPEKVTPYSKFVINAVNQDTFTAERCSVKEVSDWLKPEVQLAAFEHRAARLVAELAMVVQDADAVWSDFNIECWKLCHAHSQYVLARCSIEAVSKAGAKGMSPQSVTVLKRLSDLFALHTIQVSLGDFLEDYYISPKQCQTLRQQIKSLQESLADDVVGLVDAFDFTDHHLGSALGCADGNAYQRLWDAAQREEINQTEVVDGYKEYIVPMLTQHGAAKL